MNRSREEVYLEWLQARFEQKGGAVLDVSRTKLVSFQQNPRRPKVAPTIQRGSRCPDARRVGDNGRGEIRRDTGKWHRQAPELRLRYAVAASRDIARSMTTGLLIKAS